LRSFKTAYWHHWLPALDFRHGARNRGAGSNAAQLFGQGVSYTYDDVIFHPGHIDFGAQEVCVGLLGHLMACTSSPASFHGWAEGPNLPARTAWHIGAWRHSRLSCRSYTYNAMVNIAFSVCQDCVLQQALPIEAALHTVSRLAILIFAKGMNAVYRTEYTIHCTVGYRVYAVCTISYCSYKHAKPHNATSPTRPLHRVHHMYHSPLHPSTPTKQQTHAPNNLTQNKQAYLMWPSVGKDNPGRKLEPVDLASTPRDARYAMKLPQHITFHITICHDYTKIYPSHFCQ
jgi:hypothetical protein